MEFGNPQPLPLQTLPRADKDERSTPSFHCVSIDRTAELLETVSLSLHGYLESDTRHNDEGSRRGCAVIGDVPS